MACVWQAPGRSGLPALLAGDPRDSYGTRMSSSPCRTLIQPSGWAAHSRQAAAIAAMSSCVPSPLVRSCSVIAEPAMRSAHVPPQASREVGSA
jgi:hypothetical protein